MNYTHARLACLTSIFLSCCNGFVTSVFTLIWRKWTQPVPSLGIFTSSSVLMVDPIHFVIFVVIPFKGTSWTCIQNDAYSYELRMIMPRYHNPAPFHCASQKSMYCLVTLVVSIHYQEDHWGRNRFSLRSFNCILFTSFHRL